MGGKGSGEHLRQLNLRRSLTVKTLKQSEKAISDSQRAKDEEQAKRAASMWKKGYDAENRDK